MNSRAPAKSMVITAAIMAAWIAYEGYTAGPVIPTKGDVPTIGHGSTVYEDGTRVTMTDAPITRQRAYELAYNLHDQTYGQCVRQSLGNTPVLPQEFAIAVDFAGQYGCKAWANSSMLRETKRGNYTPACNAYLRYKFAAGYDCSTPGNRRCLGVWTRTQKRAADCAEAQP